MTVNINPGEVDIKRFQLIHTSGKVIDLTGYVEQLDIFESVKSPSIFAKMLVVDTIGMADNLLIGHSDVEIEYVSYSGPGTSVPTLFKLKILSVLGAAAGPSNKYKKYTVSMASQEFIKSSSINITENFNNTSHDEMIKQVLGYLKTEKPLSIESTKGIDSIPVSKMKPFQAIDKIRQRAVSKSEKSSAYCFYENNKGYTFATIEKIIAEGKKDPSVAKGDRNFRLDTVGRNTFADSDWRTILAHEHVKMENILEMIAHGGLKNNTWAFNLSSGQYELVAFNKKDNDNEFNLNPEALNLLQTISDEYGSGTDQDSSGSQSLIPILDNRELQRVEKQSYLRAYTLKLLSNMMNIHIHGDSVLSAGSVIHIDFPVISDITEQKSNKLISGNYIITQIRHIIIPTGKPKYSQACEILRTGFIED